MQTPFLEEDIAQQADRLNKILTDIGWLNHRSMAHRLAKYRLTVTQFMTLRAIQHFGPGCTMSDLARVADEVSATISGTVDRLEKQDLVQRSVNPGDRRSFHVSLTSLGVELLQKIEQEKGQHLAAFLVSLSPEDRLSFLRLLQTYIDFSAA